MVTCNVDSQNCYNFVPLFSETSPALSARLASAFNFCDASRQISLMCLLNLNLKSKVMLSSFSLRELFMRKSSILSVLGF